MSQIRATLAVILLLWAQPASGQEETSARNVQILVEYRSAGFDRQGTYQSSHRSNETQFLLVSDRREGRLFIGKEVPNVVWYRDYLAKEGYLTGHFVFREIGKSLIVRPRIIGNQIEVTLTPEISYETNDGTGAVAINKFSTTVVVYNGQPLEVGGMLSRSVFENNFYTRESGEALQIILTPRIMEI